MAATVNATSHNDANFYLGVVNHNPIAHHHTDPPVPIATKTAVRPAAVVKSHPTSFPQIAGGYESRIKHSSLSYLNARGRLDLDNSYNDFTNEGHMYPTHGVGDLDSTTELMSKFIKSAQGEVFELTDLGVQLKNTKQATPLAGDNAFFDYHSIPTTMLDGSAKLSNGRRIEEALPYFNDEIPADLEGEFKLDFESGMAIALTDKFVTPAGTQVPTTLASTRATPFLAQGENLAMSFFSDGPQARVNIGTVTNWRFVAPSYALDTVWFVAQAFVGTDNTKYMNKKSQSTDCTPNPHYVTESDQPMYLRPRTADETNDLLLLGTETYKNRYMKVVSRVTGTDHKAVRINNSYRRHTAFNARYPNKGLDFGDVILRDPEQVQNSHDTNITSCKNENKDIEEEALKACTKIYHEWVTNKHFEADKQVAFNLMLDKWQGDWTVFKKVYLNETTYNISVEGLALKAKSRKSYLPGNIGETGWMVLENGLTVPTNDDHYECFMGWSTLNQSPELVQQPPSAGFHFAQKKGWATHQGPGMLYLTSGNRPHIGTQEPFILQHTYPPMNDEDKAIAVQQVPYVHWRLDTKEVIENGLLENTFIETNVGAAQLMLQSVGTKTLNTVPSRSPNFLSYLARQGYTGQELIRVMQKIRLGHGEENNFNLTQKELIYSLRYTENADDNTNDTNYDSYEVKTLQDLNNSQYIRLYNKANKDSQFRQDFSNKFGEEFPTTNTTTILTSNIHYYPESNRDNITRYDIIRGAVFDFSQVYILTGVTEHTPATNIITDATANY